MGQNQIILVDTSSWIEALRSTGRIDVRERVQRLLINGLAVWCDMVALELWNGAKGNYEKKKLTELEKEITCLHISKDVWGLARELANKCRQAGKTVPSTDLIISSCALFHDIEIEHCDEHIEFILKVYKRDM